VCVWRLPTQTKMEEKISTTNSFPPTGKPVVWLRMALL